MTLTECLARGRWYRIEGPGFVAAVVLDPESGRVVERAPILKRALPLGTTEAEAVAILTRRGWRIERMDP